MSAQDAAVGPHTRAAAARRRVRARRALVVAAPVVYVLALTTVVARWGLPVARDQLFLWLGLGMAAFSVAAWRSWGSMVLEWLPLFALLVLYDFLRGAVSVAPQHAHVTAQLAIDKALGGGEVPTVWLQQHLWDPGHMRWYDVAVWAVYMTHFFVVWIVAAVLWCVARPRFRRYSVLVIVLTLAAFLTYWRYPAQPPWMAAGVPPVDRIVPEVWGRLGVSTLQSVYEDGRLVNTVAAVPSLHAAYPFMLLLFFWSAGFLVRLGLGLYTLAMGFALVYGGEHFVTDILAGWAMAGAAYALVTATPALARRLGLRRRAARGRLRLAAHSRGAPASQSDPRDGTPHLGGGATDGTSRIIRRGKPVPADHLRLSVVPVDGTVRIALEGELDIASATSFDAAVQAADGQPVVVDLAGLEFMDSSGLRSLIRATRDTHPGQLRIVGVRGRVADVIELAGLGARLPIVREETPTEPA